MLEGICFDVKSEDDVAHVLVFRKSRYGNLAKFMSSESGRATSFVDRLKMCADIAGALKTMHSIGKIRPRYLRLPSEAYVS
jgi:hypothetical protein